MIKIQFNNNNKTILNNNKNVLFKNVVLFIDYFIKIITAEFGAIEYIVEYYAPRQTTST